MRYDGYGKYSERNGKILFAAPSKTEKILGASCKFFLCKDRFLG